MNFSRIILGTIFSVATVLGASRDGMAQPAQARNYPNKSIRIIVPYGPGGGADTYTRIIGGKLVESWGQPVIADNRPGAGGVLASELAAKSPPDGYTLFMGTVSQFAVIPNLVSRLPYDPTKDFTPIGLVVISPNILVVHPSVPVKTVPDLMALAKSRPGVLTYGSAGIGSPAHLSAELFSSMTGVKMIHVPYRGGAQALVDLISGEVTLMFAGPIESLPHIKAGKVRALAVTTLRRSAAVPALPTIAEAGLPGYEVVQWNGLFAPAHAPREITESLNTEVNRILGLPDVKESLLRQGAEPSPSTPEAFGKFVQSEILKWGSVIRKAGIRLE